MVDIKELQELVVPLAKRYGVVQLDLFGSYANGTATPDSDMDFLVRFEPPVPSIFKVMGFREELKMTLGIEVDVVTLPLTNPERLHVERSHRII